MQRCIDPMARHASQPQVYFSDAFFEWLNRKEMFYVECPYAGMDFWGDPDVVLPAGEKWGAIGKISDHITIYCFYNVLMFSSIKANQKLLSSCRYRTSVTSSTPESTSYCSSRRDCGEGYPSRP